MSSQDKGVGPILALSRKQSHHYAPFREGLGREFIEVSDWDPAVVKALRPLILLTLTDDWYEADRCIRRARGLGIPTLFIMDGILEWRHQWEDPQLGALRGVAHMQPVTTDKIACLGRQSVRQVEAWGNVGKAELVGCPRLDHFLTNPVPRTSHDGREKRLLIMTANTPAFTQHQMALVEKSLADLQRVLSSQTDWKPIWRVSGALRERLGLSDDFPGLQGQSLHDVLTFADAVVTTPSTSQLEAMLAGRPTALLDYSNSPHYVPAAWRITAEDHLEPVLRDLAGPPHRRMAYQDEILHDCLECHTPAAPRMIRLIETMIESSRERREQGRPLRFAPRLLPLEHGVAALPSADFDLGALYPDNATLTNTDRVELQRQLVFAQQEICELRRKARKLDVIRRARTLLSNGRFKVRV